MKTALRPFLISTILLRVLAYQALVHVRHRRHPPTSHIAHARFEAGAPHAAARHACRAGQDSGFEITRFPLGMGLLDTLRRQASPSWRGCQWPQGSRFMVILPPILRASAIGVLFWVPVAAGLATVTIIGRQPDGDPAAERQAAAGLLRAWPTSATC